MVRSKEKNEKRNWIYLLPVVLAILVVTTCVRLSIVDLSQGEQLYLSSTSTGTDFFLEYKKMFLYGTAIFAVCFMGIGLMRKELQFQWNKAFYGFSTFLCIAIISTLVSEYKEIAFTGIYLRAEGLITYLSYFILMYYTYIVVGDKKSLPFIGIAILVVIAIQSFVGMGQAYGLDLYKTSVGKSLIIPPTHESLRETVQIRLKTGMMYGTLGNPNYLGSFYALLLPLVYGMYFYTKGKERIIIGAIAVVSTLAWYSVGSTAGFVGLVVAISVFAVACRQILREEWKAALILTGAIFLVIFGQSILSEGATTQAYTRDLDFEKVIDASSTVHKIESLQRIDANTYYLEMRDRPSIFFAYENNEFSLMSDSHETLRIQYNKAEQAIISVDERYKYFSIYVKPDKGTFDIRIGGRPLEFGVYPDKIAPIGPTGDPVVYEPAPAVGFKGYENLATGRGYIWSRTLPILFDNWLLGTGLDTFLFYFPHNDIVEKFNVPMSYHVLFDKPHSFYLQMGIGVGIPALICLLGSIAYVMLSALNAVNQEVVHKKAILIDGLLAGITGCLVSYIANDSVIGVSVLFFMGIGALMGFSDNSRLTSA